ncbi:hypothetical protein A2U01_0088804, partial [Trifolium medium]|nr:hypothetical protein [Trifolium medium]
MGCAGHNACACLLVLGWVMRGVG